MRHALLFFVLLSLSALCAGAQETQIDSLEWSLTPETALTRLSESGKDTKLKHFGKTGVPYLTSSISYLGSIWEGTLYFGDDDTLNQVLLQLDEVNWSQANRIQKLAVARFGKTYQTDVKEGQSRTDTNFRWVLPDRNVMVSAVRYKGQENVLVWFQFTPR